jgi:Fis family transcriptional regulator
MDEGCVRELLGRLIDQMVAGGITFEDGRREFERRFISRVLDETDGHLSKAAAQLGLHRNTLTRKLAELDLQPKKSKRR